jgi:hypothetical protein
MEFAVAAWPINGSSVEHFIPWPEKRYLRACLADNADSIPAENLWLVTTSTGPNLRIDRVDSDSPDFDEQISGAGFWFRELGVVQRLGVLER